MKFFHGTTKPKWNLIQKEGILFGLHDEYGSDSYRHTYLTPDINYAEGYGSIILEVEYEPVGINGKGIDNYGFYPPKGEYCWQFSVFIPIPLKNVKKLTSEEVDFCKAEWEEWVEELEKI